ncbi:adenosylhomocysteine nucleosidase [Mycolicibacterium sp. BK556]|uniref:5'-methylthioadenosine/adenosylhomocysteine nucleosidase n=1 Tax=unclassified Mycolicibacterium TaxID=2636767 RepID=UPI0016228EE9|nr:adenosylhomocysteine nucleosidase [Mycolicibacterium sp. BK556]MBB3630935.1 adenosylhomocysteine nucleosidase [Mycolicibacterium sp. BK607]MBB3748937.1 adenosylhomocysteine nucleosidase [Mycolicibacterium sp. BK634]
MPIGLICAIPQELDHLRALLSEVVLVQVAHTEFISGTLDGCDVVLAGSGMGKVNSALVATVLADRFGCGAIVFSGVAGGLDPQLHVGDVVIADLVIQHDAGLIEDDGLQTYQAGHVPFINPTDRLGYRVDENLLAQLRERLADFTLPAAAIRFGTVLSGDQYLHSDVTREQLQRDFGGLAVEMEGGAVAQVAEAFGVPWLVIRALSDLAGHDSRFDFLAFVDEVAASSVAILRHLLPVLSPFARRRPAG